MQERAELLRERNALRVHVVGQAAYLGQAAHLGGTEVTPEDPLDLLVRPERSH